MDLVDIANVLTVPAFAVLIWQQVQTSNALKDMTERYEKLVNKLIETIHEVAPDKSI